MIGEGIDLLESKLEDLNAFFEFQRDKEALYLAAFSPKDPEDKVAYIHKFSKLLKDPTIHMRTIHYEGKVVGSIIKFVMDEETEITYWIDKKYWHMGIGTRALQMFLELEATRPLYGRVAYDNYGSQRLLEKCGFNKIKVEKGFANARQAEIEEYVYKLDSRKDREDK